MATRSDAPDLAVDELRRKARRRLVGAIVLALAAAVALPLLLENEPKPLGDDVSIQIPPVDTGRFVNPLSPAAPPDAKTKADKGSTETAPTPGPARAPTTSEGAENESGSKAPDKQEGAASSASSPLAPTTSVPATKPEAQMSPEPKSVAPSASQANPEAKPGTSQAAGAFVVQVAAFSDRFGARSLVVKLKKGGFPGYTETVTTDKGTLHRVRVGPYSSREVADAARAKLKAAGFAGVVTHNG
jgi:DedD protein